MAAVAGTRALEGGGDFEFSAGVENGENVLLPRGFIEIDGEEIAGLVQQHWIDACDEWFAQCIMTGEVVVDDFAGDGNKRAVGAVGAFDPGFLTDAGCPFIGAGW